MRIWGEKKVQSGAKADEAEALAGLQDVAWLRVVNTAAGQNAGDLFDEDTAVTRLCHHGNILIHIRGFRLERLQILAGLVFDQRDFAAQRRALHMHIGYGKENADADDLGLQGGLMVSPEAYRALIKPRHERYFRLLHERSPAKVLFHTCGSVAEILDDLVEIGVDILHPVQVSAAGMQPAYLKQRWGGKLTFWGGIDTQHVLPRGSTEDVKAEVERRVEEFGRGGGYVLGAVHNIQPDVPTPNVLTMYRHARAYRPSYAV